jgi:hypothetical protein
LLGAALATPGDLITPQADRMFEQPVDAVVRAMVRATGAEPLVCESDAEAAELMSSRQDGEPWPCSFMPTTVTPTSGPNSLAYKDAVEVVAPIPVLQAFRATHPSATMAAPLKDFRSVLEAGRLGGLPREAYVRALATVVPGFTGQ